MQQTWTLTGLLCGGGNGYQKASDLVNTLQHFPLKDFREKPNEQQYCKISK